MRAENFHPLPVGIGHAAHRAGHGVVKTGPAAAGFKFVLGVVERHAALAADIGARRVIVEITARIGGLRGLAQQNVSLPLAERGHGMSGIHGCLVGRGRCGRHGRNNQPEQQKKRGRAPGYAEDEIGHVFSLRLWQSARPRIEGLVRTAQCAVHVSQNISAPAARQCPWLHPQGNRMNTDD